MCRFPIRHIAVVLISCSLLPLASAQARKPKQTPAAPAKITNDDALRFVGIWTAEFMDTTFLRIDLKLANGSLVGTIATGNIHTAADGRLTEVSDVKESKTAPLFDVVLQDGNTIMFKRHDDDDVDQMQMTLTGNGTAELRFIFPEGPDAPKLQTFQLTRRIER
jgi:hypothetical protein